MSISLDRIFDVKTTPKRLLPADPKRYSWDITNDGAVTVYYLRGARGSSVATSGDKKGVPISAGGADGYDEEDAQDEVWIVAGSDVTVTLGVTWRAGLNPAPDQGEDAGRRKGTRRAQRPGRR